MIFFVFRYADSKLKARYSPLISLFDLFTAENPEKVRMVLHFRILLIHSTAENIQDRLDEAGS